MPSYETWNCWHGCHKITEGCKHCYMFEKSEEYGANPEKIFKVKTKFELPLARNRQRQLKYPAGTLFAVCLQSDFFLEEADQWRDEAWSIMHTRNDCKFFIITKRPERIKNCLPEDWGNGYENVMLSVTIENQKRADERIPYLLDIPCKHKTLTIVPMLDSINLEPYLKTGQIEGVSLGGEITKINPRPINHEWILKIKEQCQNHSVDLLVENIGNTFVMNGKTYHLSKQLTYTQAKKANYDLNYKNLYKE